MDDDAACEPESVWRTISLLARVVEPRTAVSGAMLLEERPIIQHEKGAGIFRGPEQHGLIVPYGHGADVSLAEVVCRNERLPGPDYGAFWFFAFPLASVTRWPFPFFVRGDDMDFSLANDFKVVTLNGIATWSIDFNKKLTPATDYLVTRSEIAICFMHRGLKSGWAMVRRSLRNADASLGRFEYASARAIIRGIADALDGPSAFAENPAIGSRLASMKAATPSPALRIADLEYLRRPPGDVPAFRRWLRRFDLVAGAIPDGVRFNRRLAHVHLRHHVVPHMLVLRTRAAWGYGADTRLHVRDRAAEREVVRAALALLPKLLPHRIRAVADEYERTADAYRTRAYWDGVFARLSPPAPPAAVHEAMQETTIG
jgi:hypothetical protein